MRKKLIEFQKASTQLSVPLVINLLSIRGDKDNRNLLKNIANISRLALEHVPPFIIYKENY